MPKKNLLKASPKRSLAANGFYSTNTKKDCLYAVLVRSPASSGKIKSVTCPNLPEGYFLFDANDIPGKKIVDCNNIKSKIFGFSNVSYNGEPLAILVGPNEKELQSLLKTISFNFDIESLESAVQQVITNKRPVINIHDASAESSNDISDFVDIINELPSLDTVIDKTHTEEKQSKQVAQRTVTAGFYKTQTVQDADKQAFENLNFDMTQKWTQKLVNPKWYETDGAFCYMEGTNLHIFTPTKWTYNLQKTLHQVLEIPEEKIIIHKTKSSGIYSNGLWRTNQLATQVALAAFLTKKPIKLILSPNEQDLYMAPGVNVDITYRVGGTADGKITALKADIDIDIGSENPFAQEITDRMAIAVCNFYKIKNLYINARAHTSKNPPTTIHLKSVDSQILFATENMIQTICSETNLFPQEVRAINCVEPKNSDFPFTIELPGILDTISKTVKNSDFNRKYAAYQMDAIDRIEQDSRPFFALPLRGIGIATSYNISGYCGESSFNTDSKMEITLTSENKLIIHALKPSEVVQSIWKKTATEILQIPKQNIIIDSDFTLEESPKYPEDTFSTIGILNELVKKCCNEIQKKRFHQPLPITSKKAITSVMKKTWNKENFSGNPFHTTSAITTVVEVELDNYTYSQKIKGIWIGIDCGELFDEAAAIRTVRLEVQQELATLVQDKTLPYDNIHINFYEGNKKAGQIGELVHNTLPAAFSSAMSLALTTQITQLPVTEKQIYNLIKTRTNRGAR